MGRERLPPGAAAARPSSGDDDAALSVASAEGTDDHA
jgi:hypothetical protein